MRGARGACAEAKGCALGRQPRLKRPGERTNSLPLLPAAGREDDPGFLLLGVPDHQQGAAALGLGGAEGGPRPIQAVSGTETKRRGRSARPLRSPCSGQVTGNECVPRVFGAAPVRVDDGGGLGGSMTGDTHQVSTHRSSGAKQRVTSSWVLQGRARSLPS